MEVNIQCSGGKVTATAGNFSVTCKNLQQACKWVDSVCYGWQPEKCIFGSGSCGYPIEDCSNCPCHPGSDDPYWGMTKAVVDGG